MVVSLIGYRGTGKTTVGMLLAERLGWTCVDTDVELERRLGQSIRQMFADQGEAWFRQREAEVVADLTRRHKLVLALGGGAILRAENRQALQVAGPVVWLTATPAEIERRVSDDPLSLERRPQLTTAGGRQEIEQVLAEREPLYRQCGDVIVATDQRTPREIVDEILNALNLSPQPPLGR